MASKRAIETFQGRKTPVPGYYMSWKNWLPIMRAYEEGRAAYFATREWLRRGAGAGMGVARRDEGPATRGVIDSTQQHPADPQRPSSSFTRSTSRSSTSSSPARWNTASSSTATRRTR
jgi:hypothetical protein